MLTMALSEEDMTGNRPGARALLFLAYSIPVLALAGYIILSVTDTSLPFFTDNDSAEAHDHDHEGEYPVFSCSQGVKVGEKVPPFELEMADGITETSDDLMAGGKPVFLYFWSTT